MKIAFIKRSFSYHGGAERYLSTLMDFLKKQGHEIHIFANKWADKNNFIFHRVNILPFGSFFKAYSFNRNLNLNLEDFDIVVSFERTTNQHIYRAGEGCHARWLELRSQIEPLYRKISFKINPLHLYYLKIEREIFEKTPVIIANSVMVKDEIIRYYRVQPEKITVIYNGVDIKRFAPENRQEGLTLREKLSISENTKIILFVGSGFKRKGLDTLLKSLKLIERDIILLVIGKGDSRRYQKIAEQLGVKKKVLFLGIQREIEKLYAASDLFVLPTIYDPFSNATIEAMASGIPVVTSKNNGVSEIIEEEKEGYVLKDPFDEFELAEKINLALDNSKTMGHRARKKAEAYSIESQAERFLSVIFDYKAKFNH